MSSGDRPQLVAVPDRVDAIILEWLTEPERAPVGPVLDRAFAQLPAARRRRARPWAALLDGLRPEPFGDGRPRRAIALVVTLMALLVAVAAAGLLGAASRTLPAPSTTPSESRATPRSTSSGTPSSSPLVSSAAQRVFPLASSDLTFVISDGRHLATIASDGTGRREIGLDVPGDLVWPEWLSANTILALQGSFAPTEQMWAIPTDGGTSQVMIPCYAPCRSRNEAAVSHDRTTLVFVQAFGEVTDGIPKDCGLALYSISTQDVSSVTKGPCAVTEERHPRFSPNDRQLAFWRSRSVGGHRGVPIADSALFIRTLSSGSETQVTPWTADATHLDWSPDGRWIVFIPRVWDDGADGADIYRIHPDGSSLERLTQIDTATQRILRPLFTPDGQSILFMLVNASGGQLMVIPSGGGTAVPVLPGTNVLEYNVRPSG